MGRTYALVAVAVAPMSDPSVRHFRSGVMYPVLRRMLDEGWLSGEWEDQAQAGPGKRPPRRYYELTDEGRTARGPLVAEVRHDARFACLAGSGGGMPRFDEARR